MKPIENISSTVEADSDDGVPDSMSRGHTLNDRPDFACNKIFSESQGDIAPYSIVRNSSLAGVFQRIISMKTLCLFESELRLFPPFSCLNILSRT